MTLLMLSFGALSACFTGGLIYTLLDYEDMDPMLRNATLALFSVEFAYLVWSLMLSVKFLIEGKIP